jgi:hypothetical protein
MTVIIEWLVNRIFWWERLRQAVTLEVHYYDDLEKAMNEPTNNLSWREDDGLWYGYTYNEMHKTYLFDVVGEESLADLWDNLWARDMEWGLMYK